MSGEATSESLDIGGLLDQPISLVTPLTGPFLALLLASLHISWLADPALSDANDARADVVANVEPRRAHDGKRMPLSRRSEAVWAIRGACASQRERTLRARPTHNPRPDFADHHPRDASLVAGHAQSPFEGNARGGSSDARSLRADGPEGIEALVMRAPR